MNSPFPGLWAPRNFSRYNVIFKEAFKVLNTLHHFWSTLYNWLNLPANNLFSLNMLSTMDDRFCNIFVGSIKPYPLKDDILVIFIFSKEAGLAAS